MQETESTSVGADFPAQMMRARDLLDAYRAIGPEGAFGATVIETTIANAQRAWESGDIVQIVDAYDQLRNLE